MMKLVVALCLVGVVMSQRSADSGKFAHQYVLEYWNILSNAQVFDLLASPTPLWPVHTGPIEPPSFTCESKQYPGFYADPATKCQTFHRCDVNGNLTSYICVNMTVFNPITLVCDYWFDVDCAGFIKDEYFANRRLYQTALPLFDSKASGTSMIHGGPNGEWVWVQTAGSGQTPTKPKPAAPPKASGSASAGAQATTEAASEATTQASS